MDCITTLPTGGNCVHHSTIKFNNMQYKFIISQYYGTYNQNIDGNNYSNCLKYNIMLYNDSLNFIQFDYYKQGCIEDKEYNKFYTLENKVYLAYSYDIDQKMIFYGNYVMINDKNKLNIYNNQTLQLIKTLTTKNKIMRINTYEKYLVLQDGIKNNHGSGFQTNDIYNWNFDFIKSINKEIMFVEQDIIIVHNDGNYLYNIKKDTFINIDGSVLDLKDGIVHVYTKHNEIKLFKQKADDTECSICLNNLDEVFALVPCGHTNLCTKCYTDKSLLHCPICRKDINMRIKIYK